MPAIVGALACQRNSFLKTLRTHVVACREFEPLGGKKDGKLYEVEFEDTVLFPEGGGQPHDTGVVTANSAKIDVVRVLRRQLSAVHIVGEKLEEGTPVEMAVDWARRLDVMQQHTGQHLISAVFDSLGLETLLWLMGDPVSYIELPRRVDDATVAAAAAEINRLIVDNLPVTVDAGSGEEDTSHIPKDYSLEHGVVRVVSIGDMDRNPCCGTHLQSTGQIQAVALLHQANVRGGHSKLHFACGGRVPRLAMSHHGLARASGALLLCQTDEVPLKIGDLLDSYRRAQQRETALLKQLAALEAARVRRELLAVDVAVVHHESPAFLAMVQKEVKTEGTVVYLSGKGKEGGTVKVTGDRTDEIAQLIQERVAVKGGGRGLFQGKIAAFGKGELEAVLADLASAARTRV